MLPVIKQYCATTASRLLSSSTRLLRPTVSSRPLIRSIHTKQHLLPVYSRKYVSQPSTIPIRLHRCISTSERALSSSSAPMHPEARDSSSPNTLSSNSEASNTTTTQQRPRDPWRITSGKWYSPELKRRAIQEQIAERDAALPKHVCSTPLSLPYPSTEAETQLLSDISQRMHITPPTTFGLEILPYWTAQAQYKAKLTGIARPTSPDAPVAPLELPSHFNSILQLSSTTTEVDVASSLSTLYAITKLDPKMPSATEQTSLRVESSEPISSSPSLSLDGARLLAEVSEDALKKLLPAMVEADPYWAGEALTQVLRERGVLELSESLTASLNPRQLTSLLPAMCRVNPTWREDGLFDLLVEVLSTGGILRWEPEDVAKVIAELPKVAIATDYYTSPELDPSNPNNENKTPTELLHAAQKMARESGEARWDHSSYGLPGDFLLTPSKEDIEMAKREYEAEVMNKVEDVESEVHSEALSDAPPGIASEFPNQNESKIEIDVLDFLDVSHNVAPTSTMLAEFEEAREPAYYNPIAWQPEEIGRLVGTMLSQELELDDIVNVISGLALEGWKDSAQNAPWHAYMGYMSTVLSDALAANKHWVDEDYTWVAHDVIAKVGPWALRQWPDYRADEHQQWLADLVAQTAIKYGRFTHDYRLIQVMLNMVCDNWPEHEHQKLADMVALRMKDRTYVGRAQNWFKWRVTHTYKERFSDQR